MSKKKEHVVGAACYYGDTVAEAKKEAQCAIHAAFTGDYVPTVLQYRGHLLVVYRHAWEEWIYRIVDNEDLVEGRLVKAYNFTSGREIGYVDALRYGTRHLAQMTWKPEDGMDVPDFVQDEDRDEVRSWQRWQLRYAYFKAQGASDDRCHSMASDSRQLTPFDDAPK